MKQIPIILLLLLATSPAYAQQTIYDLINQQIRIPQGAGSMTRAIHADVDSAIASYAEQLVQLAGNEALQANIDSSLVALAKRDSALYITTRKFTDSLAALRSEHYRQSNDDRELLIGSNTDYGNYKLQVSNGFRFQGLVNQMEFYYTSVKFLSLIAASTVFTLDNNVDAGWYPMVVKAHPGQSVDLARFYTPSSADYAAVTKEGYLRAPTAVYSTGGYGYLVHNSSTRLFEKLTAIPLADVAGLQTALDAKLAIDTTIATLTDATTITWNAAHKIYKCASVSITGTGKTFNFTNLTTTGQYVLTVTQGTGGNHTITTWDSRMVWLQGSAPVLKTAAGEKDIITFWFDGTKIYGAYVAN